MQRFPSTNLSVVQYRSRRRGTALSELAICLPLITLVVFGGIETADMVFLKETLKSATYEGARAGAKFDSNNTEVEVRTNVLLDARHVRGTDLEILLPDNHTDVSQLNRGEIFEIKLSAPADTNTVAPLNLFEGWTISASTFMVRE